MTNERRSSVNQEARWRRRYVLYESARHLGRQYEESFYIFFYELLTDSLILTAPSEY